MKITKALGSQVNCQLWSWRPEYPASMRASALKQPSPTHVKWKIRYYRTLIVSELLP